MKQYLSHILVSAMLLLASILPARAADDVFFEYPQAPDTLTSLQDRCDYLVSRFWQRCNFDYAMRHQAQFNDAFGTWVCMMPYATADTVHTAINSLLKRFEKKDGDITLRLAQMADAWLYSDTASLHSEEILMPFAAAAASHRKINKADKQHFVDLTRILESSALGSTVPKLDITLRDGSKSTLKDVKGRSILLFFDSADCIECLTTRIRLETDQNAKALTERGELAIVHLRPQSADDKWKADVASLPEYWVVAAMPEAEQYFDLRQLPAFFFLNSAGKVIAKDLDADYLLGAFERANQVSKAKTSAQ